MVHLYIYVPCTDTVADDVADVALPNVVVPGPDTMVHRPVPTVGASPPSDAITNDPQMFCVPIPVAVVGVA